MSYLTETSMTFLTRLSASALLVAAAFGLAAPAGAHQIKQQPFVESRTSALLRTVQSLGIRVAVDAPDCQKDKALMGAASNEGTLLICVGNHGGDTNEMADTVRHETLHLAQYCKGRSIGKPFAALFPENTDQWIDYAQEHLHWHILGYDSEQWAVEAEARVLAQALDEQQVAKVLATYCGS